MTESMAEGKRIAYILNWGIEGGNADLTQTLGPLSYEEKDWTDQL